MRPGLLHGKTVCSVKRGGQRLKHIGRTVTATSLQIAAADLWTNKGYAEFYEV